VIRLTCVSTFKYQIHQLFNESEKWIFAYN
jgi:fluoride ion exporter CrcB/FEX